MGSGKTTVGQVLAPRLGAELVDLDARIAARAQKTVREVFAEHGEAHFRVLEREELDRVLAEPGAKVVALGGGTVVDDRSRRKVLESGVVVTLAAPVEVLAARVAGEEGRPLLMGKSAVEVLRGLLADRAHAYAECHARIDSAREVGAIADEIAALAAAPPIVVPLGTRTYRVEIARGISARLGERVKPFSGAITVTDSNVAALPLASAMTGARVVLEPGEEHKTIAAVERIWDGALDAGIDRDGIVIGLGGGVVGDLAGFAAATILRGVAFGLVPTTLLAMVDASIGGKTGFDRRHGKNLVGAFHQPSFVLVDPDALATLPDRDYRAGFAEVIKTAWLDSEEAVVELERRADALAARDADALAAIIRRSIRYKARVVANDERESGERRLLNLGHTVGHAIEVATAYREYLHGEAVSLGLVAAWRVSRSLGRASAAEVERMTKLLARFGLPIDLDRALDEAVLAAIASDKKKTRERIRFIVPSAPGRASIDELAIAEIRRAVAP
jgi:shikimate kinase/3-dehydroquinate synthase